MPLPKINTPTFELVLPSTAKKIKYRPFLVREEKILIMAMESEDTSQITSAIVQILNQCILTRGIKIEKLSTFDIEYLFLNVRAKSVGETVEVNVICPDDGETKVNAQIYIDEIEVKKDKNHSLDIKLDGTYTMRLKYPSLDQFIDDNFNFDDVSKDNSFDIIASCIDMVFSDEEAWEAKDCTKKELIDFVERLDSNQFKQIYYNNGKIIVYMGISQIKNILCFCVGSSTEKTARSRGFQQVFAADGNVRNLKELVEQNLKSKDSKYQWVEKSLRS
mgnify:CR=1 FL=1